MTLIRASMEQIESGNRDYWTIRAMEKFGGSFVKRLAELAQHADSLNLAIIKKSWPEYWAQYETTGRALEERMGTDTVVLRPGKGDHL